MEELLKSPSGRINANSIDFLCTPLQVPLSHSPHPSYHSILIYLSDILSRNMFSPYFSVF